MEREPGRTGGWMRALAAGPLVVCIFAISGCWPFGRTPPQQQYFNALKMGNAAQASQLWLHMTPEQRARFERGEDIRPSVSHDDVQQAIDEHYANQDDDGSAPRQVQTAPDLGGGLQDLPAYLKAAGGGDAQGPAPTSQ